MSMKYAALFVVLVIMTSIIPAHAVQLNAGIAKNSEKFIPTFHFVRIIKIQYDENSKLAELIGNMQHKITFDINSENAVILVDRINSELEKKSFVKVMDINGEYTVVIRPQKDSVTLEYNLILRPTMQDHFIGNSATLDSQWRGFKILEEIPVETEFGTYDINSPKSAFEARLPNTLEYISESDAMKILELKLVDTSGLSGLPLSEWESMFDPTAKMSEIEHYGFSGNVITNYSMGICTIFRGICQDKIHQEKFVIDGEEYLIKSIESQDDATIIIEGYVNEDYLGKIEIFTIRENAIDGNLESTVLYAISGIMVVIAVGFFVWSDRKVKKTATEQTGIDPKDLRVGSIGTQR